MSSLNLKQVGVFVAAILAATVILFAIAGSRPEYLPAYLVLTLTGTILIWNMARCLSDQIPWYSPHVFFLGWMFLIEVAASVVVVIYDMPSEAFRRSLYPNELFWAGLMGLVAVGGYLLGWRWGPKGAWCSPMLERALQDSPASRLWIAGVSLLLCVLSCAAWVYMFRAAGGWQMQLADQGSGRGDTIDAAGGAVWHVARFGFASTLMLLSSVGFWLFIAPVMIGVFMLFLMVFGSRLMIIQPLLGTLIVYRSRFAARIPRVVWVAVAAAVFFIATFWAVLRASKGDVNEAMFMYESATQSVADATMLTFGQMTFIIQRAELMTYLAETPDYQWGRTFLSLLKGVPIPQAWWPGKADLPAGSTYYLERLRPDALGKVSLTSVLFTEFYINFWWPGVLIGSFVTGYVVRWFHSRLVANPYRREQVVPAAIIGLLAGLALGIIKSGINEMASLPYYFVPIFLAMGCNLLFGRGYEMQTSPQGMFRTTG